jgi:hypothetical protein
MMVLGILSNPSMKICKLSFFGESVSIISGSLVTFFWMRAPHEHHGDRQAAYFVTPFEQWPW